MAAGSSHHRAGPAGSDGSRRPVDAADQLRCPDRGHLRARRGPRPAGRRHFRADGVRLRLDPSGDHGPAHSAGPGGGARHQDGTGVADLPFGSYQSGVPQALHNATRYLKEGGAQAVKLEGGRRVLPQVEAMTAAGIPVMGHLGVTPQSINALGSYQSRGRGREGDVLLADALALERAGAFAVVLEAVPASLGARVSDALAIPTVGVGGGPSCDAQGMVWQDFAGLTTGRAPRFVRRYAQLAEILDQAAGQFRQRRRGRCVSRRRAQLRLTRPRPSNRPETCYGPRGGHPCWPADEHRRGLPGRRHLRPVLGGRPRLGAGAGKRRLGRHRGRLQRPATPGVPADRRLPPARLAGPGATAAASPGCAGQRPRDRRSAGARPGRGPAGERVVLEDETYRVYADPAGHPFCLVQLETT